MTWVQWAGAFVGGLALGFVWGLSVGSRALWWTQSAFNSAVERAIKKALERETET